MSIVQKPFLSPLVAEGSLLPQSRDSGRPSAGSPKIGDRGCVHLLDEKTLESKY